MASLHSWGDEQPLHERRARGSAFVCLLAGLMGFALGVFAAFVFVALAVRV